MGFWAFGLQGPFWASLTPWSHYRRLAVILGGVTCLQCLLNPKLEMFPLVLRSVLERD